MYRLALVAFLGATAASAVQNVERAGDCSSGNLWQGEYCCPGTFIYQQDTMDEPICCAGDSADDYYFNSGPSSCTAGTSTPITAFDKSGNAASGAASATGSSITTSTTLATVTAETTSSDLLSSASAGASGNAGSSVSASVALTSSISSAASASQTSSPASTTSSDGAASMITSGPLGLAIGALGALVLL